MLKLGVIRYENVDTYTKEVKNASFDSKSESVNSSEDKHNCLPSTSDEEQTDNEHPNAWTYISSFMIIELFRAVEEMVRLYGFNLELRSQHFLREHIEGITGMCKYGSV